MSALTMNPPLILLPNAMMALIPPGGDDSREIAGLAIDQTRQVIQPNEAQRAALDDLANALTSAAQMIQASCPTQTAFTAPDRLAVMQRRIGAMIQAELAVQQPLGKFYDLVED